MTRKLVYTATAVVWVSVRWEPNEFPKVPDDGGLVRRLLDFINENDIVRPRVGGGVTGVGMFSAPFYAKDAKRVVAWLRENGVEPKGE